MEFSEKLQKFRTNEQLTQEELAEKLYVSRTAISKWESGRGYPSIDSLKAIAKYFNVTIDELICGDEIVALAEQDKKESGKKFTILICGILDCLIVLLFFLPVFGDGGIGTVSSVNLFGLTSISSWVRNIYIVIMSLTVFNGFCTVVISSLEKPLWSRHRLITGIALSTAGTLIFVLTRQPYAGAFCLCLLVIKGFLVIKSK